MSETKNRKLQIAETAAALFSEKGFSSVSVRELADAVGLETSSMYSHFASKEEILYALATECANDFQQTLAPLIDSPLHTREKLKRMLVTHVEVTLRNRHRSAIFTTEWKHLKEPHRSEFALERENYENAFRQVIQKGIEEHVFRNLDVRLATLALLSSLNSIPQWYRPEGDLKPEEIGEMLSDVLLNGLVGVY